MGYSHVDDIMSLFHQQKWCLDKIQLTVIQSSEFFFAQ